MTENLPDEIDLLFAEDTTPLDTFLLSDDGQRFKFLWRLSEIGEEGLLQATSHVWGSLATPRTVRCGLMAAAVCEKGTGKLALHAVLQSFLKDFEIECDPPPLPLRLAFDTSAEWHAAVHAHFAAGDEAMEAVVNRYSAVLNGDDPQAVNKPSAVVLTGPWKLPDKS